MAIQSKIEAEIENDNALQDEDRFESSGQQHVQVSDTQKTQIIEEQRKEYIPPYEALYISKRDEIVGTVKSIHI